MTPNRCPARLHRLPSSRTISGGRGTAGARGVPPSRLHAVAADRAQPGADAAAHLAGAARARGRDDPAFLAVYDAAHRRARRARAARAGHVVAAHASARRAGPIAYFSAEFALHQSLPIYAGGLGVLAGDHCKEASDLGVPLDRRRLHVSAGLLPPARLARRLAAGSLRAAQLGRRADRAAPHARRQAVHRRRCRSATRSVLVQVWRSAARPRDAAPARHRSRGERAVGSRAVGAPLRRRPRHAPPAGNHPRPRRRAARCGARPAARGLAPQRRPRRVRRAAADPRLASSRARSWDDALEEVRRTTVFTTHTPVPAGHDAFPFHLVETASRRLLGHRSAATATRSWRSATTTTAAGPQFNMTALALRSAGAINARQPAARRGDARDVGADLAGRRRTTTRPVARDHQRRARADLDVERDGARCSTTTCSPAGAIATTTRRSGRASCEIPDEELWAARQALRALPVPVHPRARARSAGRTNRSAPARVVAGRHAARSERADDRLRAPLHRLQAARADLPRRRSAAGAS